MQNVLINKKLFLFVNNNKIVCKNLRCRKNSPKNYIIDMYKKINNIIFSFK